MKKLTLILILYLLITGNSFTTVKTWVGGYGIGGQKWQWNRDNNWNPIGVPTASDSVVIPLTQYNPVNMNSAPGICGALTLAGGSIYLSSNLNIANTSGYGGNLTIENGTLSVLNFTLTVTGNTVTNTNISYTTGRMNLLGTLTLNNISGTGKKYLFSANNYLEITSPGITSITIKEYSNTIPPYSPPEYDSTYSVKRYYEILSVTGSGSASLRLDYLASEIGSNFTPTNGNVWQYQNTGPWVNQGASYAGSYYVETAAPLSSTELVGYYAIADATSALPIQLAFFTAYLEDSNKITLVWETISEIDNFGFYVEKFDEATQRFITIEESFQPGAGSTLIPQRYTWTDENITSERNVYRLLQIDNNGLQNYSQPIVVMFNPNSIGDENGLTTNFILHQNYPNPFNPVTKITFSVSNNGYTTLKVFNLLGQEVATLFSDEAHSGKIYEVNFNGKDLPSGIYISRLQSGSNMQTQKMILSK